MKRIVCTEQMPMNHPATDAHIVAVGVGVDPNRATERLTLDQVLAEMGRGETFYTQGMTSGAIAYVERYDCVYCRRTYIRSRPDRVYDNNLDSLRFCTWK